MKAIKLWGGIGNQLFQYGFGLYISKLKNEDISFFTSKSKKNKLPQISHLITDLPIASDEYLKENNYYFHTEFEERINRKLIQLCPILNRKVLVEQKMGYLQDISDRFNIFDGYWQSYKYLINIEKAIAKHINFNSIKYNKIAEIDDIENTNSVSIHIRRGDYLSIANRKIFHECKSDYYEKSIEYIKKNIKNPIFYVFSNEIEWAKENLFNSQEKNNNFIFIDNSKLDNSDLLDLYLMSLCKHNIIANSTFSWWGGWLNANPNKIIIAPLLWYNGKLNKYIHDLIPNNWIRF
jgi:hypothetical protein